jgi:acyl-coenzyme A synthetase/AMP-(fatty) acid ligase
LSFDASISEIGMALGAGATLCLLRSSADLARALIEQRIDIVTLPPSVVASLSDSELSGLKTLVVAGESCPDELAAHWASRCHFINAYGPTETTVCASYYECKGGEHVWIGRPIWNTQLYVLDEEQEPVPVGVAGELYIGGVGLARGYLNRAGLTAQRFVPSPFGEGERLYRTGDRVRYREDGNLEFLGRLDHQVKIRGHRIELGEIEAVLQRHGSVQQAVVVAREDVPGSRTLVGYVVGKGSEVPQAPVLQKYLQESLPQYMVPAAIVVLEQIPLTANGKIDRKALPAPDQIHSGVEYVGARTPVEEALVKIWSEVLRVPRVGVHDNFFELGGHSLLATQMIARVREVLEVDIPMRVLFQAPAVEKFAARVIAVMLEGVGQKSILSAVAEGS